VPEGNEKMESSTHEVVVTRTHS